MAFSIKEWVFGGQHFCFCLPTRLGVIVMSFLSLLLSALLAIIIWFEVSTTLTLSGEKKAAFIVAGLFETLLLVASILGFSGAIAKKYLFLAIYAYFIYIHFLLNAGIAGYFLYVIVHGSNTAVVKACKEGLKNMDAQDQCEGLLKVTKNVYLVIASLVLIIELYGALIVTRYMRQLRNEKRRAKFRTGGKSRMKHGSHPSEDIGLLVQPISVPRSQQFDPYAEYSDATPLPGHHPMTTRAVEEGYGGGRWSYDEVREEEKRAHRTSLSTVEEDIAAERPSFTTERSPPSTPRLPLLDTNVGPYHRLDDRTMRSEPPSYSTTPTIAGLGPHQNSRIK